MIHIPMGRLLRRSAHTEDRPALFAAHFSLSHACWLIAYPTVGWLGATLELSLTFWNSCCGMSTGLCAGLESLAQD